MNLESYLRHRRELIDRTLDFLLPSVGSLQKTVVESMRYSLLAPGKRVRPILCLAGAEAVCGHYEPFVHFSCAIEMIHAYSLIHDDLPAMDDDDFRRGLPTNHKRFGEAAAILAGDGLLTEAFDLMTRLSLHPGLQADRLLEATNLVADAAGFRGMVGGQMVDMEAQGKEPVLDVVEYMHGHKTAALMGAATGSGAVLAGGTGSQIQSLYEYGRHLGMAFQIRDDLLDVLGKSQDLGKPVGSDEAKRKATFPAVMGVQASVEREQRMVDEALRALAAMDERSDPLRALALHLLQRTK